MLKWERYRQGLIYFLGKAGTGKTYTAVKYYTNKGFKVLVLTATNNTAKALAKSLGVDIKTICSGAFNNNPPVQYYVDFKDISEYDVVIIDEALLAGTPRVFDLIEEFRDRVLFVVCTDERQMLPDLQHEGILERFIESKNSADCVEYFEETFRAQDDVTKQFYSYWYNRAQYDDKLYSSDDLKNMFDVVSLDEYKNDTLYICVSNRCEDFLFSKFNLATRKGVDKIPKGSIASQTSCNRRLPVLTQNQAKELGVKAWYGVDNCASICRTQWKTADGEVILIMEQSSMVSDKGVYTAYTRVRRHENFHVCIIPDVDNVTLDIFCDLPVKDIKSYHMNKTKGELLKMSADDRFNTIFEDVDYIFNKDTEKTYFDKKNLFTKDKKHITVVDENTIVFNNEKVMRMQNGSYLGSAISTKRTKWSREYKNGELNINPYNLAKKMTPLNYMDDVYSIAEQHGVRSLNYFTLGLPYNNKMFEFDLRKAYPHAFYLSPIPCAGFLSHEYNSEMLNWYFVSPKGSKEKQLATEKLVNLLRQYELFDIEFAFATPFTIGCSIGEVFQDLLKTKEGTDSIYSAVKLVKSKDEFDENGDPVVYEERYYEWGWFMKDYIEKKGKCYVRNSEFCWQLMIFAVISEMTYQTLNTAIAVKGINKREGVHVDAFMLDEWNEEIRAKIESTLDDGWDYRILTDEQLEGAERYKNGKYIMYQNFNVETKEQRKKRMDAERMKAKYDAKKAEKKA